MCVGGGKHLQGQKVKTQGLGLSRAASWVLLSWREPAGRKPPGKQGVTGAGLPPTLSTATPGKNSGAC